VHAGYSVFRRSLSSGLTRGGVRFAVEIRVQRKRIRTSRWGSPPPVAG
jgi:hypothetical protein